jgi:predicted nucleotidyltransferase
MIIEKANVKILRVFAENWFRALDIEEIAKLSNLGRTWTYKTLNNLKKYTLIIERNKRYLLNMENNLCMSLKQAFDIERVYMLDEKISTNILSLLNHIKLKLGNDLSSILLIGSTARMKTWEESDIDFIVVAKGKLEIAKPDINIILLSQEEFEKKYMECDEFVLTSLAYGLLLYDTNFIINFLRKPLPFPTSEKIEEKKEFVRKTLERTYTLLEINDMEQANKELKNILTLLARVEILGRKEIPKSRLELIQQTKDKFLSESLGKLLKGKVFSKNKVLEICERIENYVE